MRFVLNDGILVDQQFLDLSVNEDFDITKLDQIVMKLRKYATVLRTHFSKHKAIYRIGAATVIILLATATGVSASPTDITTSIVSGSPASDIDSTVSVLYKEILKVGKWAIIIKGAFDTVSNTIQGDFVAARKNAFAYILIYVILLGLPWAFEKIEDVFQGVI